MGAATIFAATKNALEDEGVEFKAVLPDLFRVVMDRKRIDEIERQLTTVELALSGKGFRVYQEKLCPQSQVSYVVSDKSGKEVRILTKLQ